MKKIAVRGLGTATLVVALGVSVPSSSATEDSPVPAQSVTPSETAAFTGIRVSLQLDCRDNEPVASNDGWLTPPLHGTALHHVCARADGIDVNGGTTDIRPFWVPEDPGMVTVSPGEGGQIRIAVTQPGRSLLRVTQNGVSTTLVVTASKPSGPALVIDIAQSAHRRLGQRPARR